MRSTLNSLPVIGGVFESIWGSPEQEAKQAAMEQAKQAMFKYRPMAMDARMNAMNNSAAAFGPMQQLMGQMYGPGAQVDMGQLIQNPFSDDAQKEMRQQANQQAKPAQMGGIAGHLAGAMLPSQSHVKEVGQALRKPSVKTAGGLFKGLF